MHFIILSDKARLGQTEQFCRFRCVQIYELSLYMYELIGIYLVPDYSEKTCLTMSKRKTNAYPGEKEKE